MRPIALVLASSVTLQLNVAPSVFAATSTLSTTTTITTDVGGAHGSMPVNKVGNLLLVDSIAIINGSSISIEGKSSDGTSQSHLLGKVFKVDQTGSGITGIAHFTDGPDLSKLETKECKEHVDLTDGTQVPGPISEVTADAITAGGKTIPMSQVASVHSSHTFLFHAKTNQNGRMTFEATCDHGGGGAKVSHDKNVFQRHPIITTTVIVGVGVGIACAIAIPIALTHHHHHPVYGYNPQQGNVPPPRMPAGLAPPRLVPPRRPLPPPTPPIPPAPPPPIRPPFPIIPPF